MSTGDSTYAVAGNLFWQHFLYSATFGTPINAMAIEGLRRRHFPDVDNPPARFPVTIVIAVPDAKVPNLGMTLKRISPEEHSHAAIFACEDALSRSDAIKRRWLHMFRNAPFVFRKVPDSSLDWTAQQIREDALGHGQAGGPISLTP